MTWTGCLVSAVSVALLLFVALCYQQRFDSCAVITCFPPWVWLLPGVALALLQCWLGRCREGKIIAVLWLAFLLYFADSPMSLLRGPWRRVALADNAKADGSITVVTLNCASSTQAAAEVADFQPDIVLLQESPGADALESLCRQLYGDNGGVVCGPDASIIARGQVTPIVTPASQRGDCVQARVRLPSGVEIVVISLRLLPVEFRLDLWTPDCWQTYAANRRRRCGQLAVIAAEFEALPRAASLIVGGDFNAPPGDPVFAPLRPRLVDVFRSAGTGWGNTMLNDWPVSRIDQIWASWRFRVLTAHAQATQNSDHRMVICNLVPEPLQSE